MTIVQAYALDSLDDYYLVERFREALAFAKTGTGLGKAVLNLG
jgi:hypothetical protein